MTAYRAHRDAAVGVLVRELVVFASYRARLVTTLLSAAFTMALFYYISRLIRIDAFGTPDEYFAFVVVGLVTIQVLTSALVLLPGAMRQELVAGTFERVLLSPFGPVGGLLAMMVFQVLLALLTGFLMVVFAALVFGLPVDWTTAPLAVPAAALGALAFAPFALLMAAVVLAFKQAGGGTQFVVAAIGLVAGFYFPVTLLPEWIQWASEVQPFTPAVELSRHLLVGTAMADPVGIAVLKLVVFTIGLLPLSLWALNRAIHSSRRRGTIIEY